MPIDSAKKKEKIFIQNDDVIEDSFWDFFSFCVGFPRRRKTSLNIFVSNDFSNHSTIMEKRNHWKVRHYDDIFTISSRSLRRMNARLIDSLISCPAIGVSATHAHDQLIAIDALWITNNNDLMTKLNKQSQWTTKKKHRNNFRLQIYTKQFDYIKQKPIDYNLKCKLAVRW